MAQLSEKMEGREKSFSSEPGISIFLQRRSEKDGEQCLPCNWSQSSDFYSGTYRCRKTMSTIFPAVRAVGEGKGETIFYLTAKTITRTVAQEAFEVLREKGMKYKVVTITAKEKLCFMDETKCDPVHCPYARGHFDRSMTLSMSCGRRRADMTGRLSGSRQRNGRYVLLKCVWICLCGWML